MSGSNEYTPAGWVSCAYPHLPIDLDNQFHIDAIALLSKVSTGPHNVYGRPLLGVDVQNAYDPFEDDLNAALIAAVQCPWCVWPNGVSVTMTNIVMKAYAKALAEWPGLLEIRGVERIVELEECTALNPEMGVQLDSTFRFITEEIVDGESDFREFCLQTFTEVTLWKPGSYS